jgi:SOS-response transcriptional repressor LexA
MNLPTANALTPTAATTSNTYAEATLETQSMAMPECAGGESFALMVMGHSMVPEFLENEIILIEPEGLATEGCYVLAWHADAWTFRQLLKAGAGWVLHPLNPAFADEPIADLSCVRGVIVQKALPGRRRASKYYV